MRCSFLGRNLVSERGKLGTSTAPVKLLGVDDAFPGMAQPQHLRRIAAKPLETGGGGRCTNRDECSSAEFACTGATVARRMAVGWLLRMAVGWLRVDLARAGSLAQACDFVTAPRAFTSVYSQCCVGS